MSSTTHTDWFRRFELSPSSGRNVDVLDGLRALAVIGIFIRHAWGLGGSPRLTLPTRWLGLPDIDLTPLLVMSSNGVDLFFVLSGFLLSRSFIAASNECQSPPSTRRFMRARAYRILPAYWLSLGAVVLVFLPLLVEQSQLFSKAGAVAVAAHILVLQTAIPGSYGMWGPGSPYWTLTLEVLFYISLPWVVRLFYGARAKFALAAAALLSFAWLTMARSWLGPLMRFIAEHASRPGASEQFVRYWMSKQLPGYAFSFAVGIFVAKLTLDRRTEAQDLRSRRIAPFVFAAGAIIVAYFMRYLGLRTLKYQFYDGLTLIQARSFAGTAFYYLEGPSMAVGFGLILWALVAAPLQTWTAPFRWRPVRLIGVLGFAIYLWHMPFLYLYLHVPFVFNLAPTARWLTLMGLGAAALTAVSLFSFFLVEKPMIDRGRIKAVSQGSKAQAKSPPLAGAGTEGR